MDVSAVASSSSVNDNTVIDADADTLTSDNDPTKNDGRVIGAENCQHSHETTLVVLQPSSSERSTSSSCNSNFIDFVRLSWELQQQAVVDQGYERDLQLVLFHPQATHQTYGSDGDDNDNAADYTIRSPYPTVHLLREVDVMRAVTSSYNTNDRLESLPSRNKERLIQLGADVCRKRLAACHHPTTPE
jgi:hypothetical protein